jgi:hypothetical protein
MVQTKEKVRGASHFSCSLPFLPTLALYRSWLALLCLPILLLLPLRAWTVRVLSNGSSLQLLSRKPMVMCVVSLLSSSMFQHNTTQHNTTQHNTTQHITTQHNTTQHNTTQHNTTQHNTTQHNTTQHNTTQHNTTQHNLDTTWFVVQILMLTYSLQEARPTPCTANSSGRSANHVCRLRYLDRHQDICRQCSNSPEAVQSIG